MVKSQGRFDSRGSAMVNGRRFQPVWRRALYLATKIKRSGVDKKGGTVKSIGDHYVKGAWMMMRRSLHRSERGEEL